MSRRFLITGGSQGIGAWLVAHARKSGHQVVFTGRNRSRVDDIARESGAHGVVADVSIDADNARAVQACMQEMGGIDVLINNAGVGYSAEIDRKSTRLNSSHSQISYAVFCLKKKTTK